MKGGRDAGSVVPRRQLVRELRALRMEAGLTVEAAARAIGRSTPTLWRMEKGLSPMRPGDVAGICKIYGADDRTTEALMALAAETKSPGWWRSYNGAIPKWFDTYIGLENAANHIRVYNDTAVPGLLQTQQYAEVTVHAAHPEMSDHERRERVAVRLRRQALLTRPRAQAPRVDFVIGESVLYRGLCHRSMMVEQLKKLTEAARLPNVTIRVLPMAKSLDCAPDARFILLTFPQDRRGQAEPPVVYADSLTGALYLTKPAEIEAYEKVWSATWNAALDEYDSMRRVTEQIERVCDEMAEVEPIHR